MRYYGKYSINISYVTKTIHPTFYNPSLFNIKLLECFSRHISPFQVPRGCDPFYLAHTPPLARRNETFIDPSSAKRPHVRNLAGRAWFSPVFLSISIVTSRNNCQRQQINQQLSKLGVTFAKHAHTVCLRAEIWWYVEWYTIVIIIGICRRNDFGSSINGLIVVCRDCTVLFFVLCEASVDKN